MVERNKFWRSESLTILYERLGKRRSQFKLSFGSRLFKYTTVDFLFKIQITVFSYRTGNDGLIV